MKSLWMLFATLLFATLPAVAQHGGGHASGGHSYGGHAAAPQHESRPAAAPAQNRGGAARGEQHAEQHGNPGYRVETPHERYHYAGGGAARNYWHGGRYDHEYFVGHWGGYNRFYWGNCNWYGPRFGVGSYFWFNGGYFTIIDPVPPFWYDEEVYVDWVDGYGYVLINPMFPGVYYHVGVRF